MTICIHTPKERQVQCPCPLCQVEQLESEVKRLQSESMEHKKLALQYAASDKFWTDLAVARNKTIGRLGEEIAQLRGNISLAEEGLANYQQEVRRIQQEWLTWAMYCECTCKFCERLSSVIRLSVPQSAEQQK